MRHSSGAMTIGLAVALAMIGCNTTKAPVHLVGHVVVDRGLAPLSGALIRVSGHT